MIILLIGLQPRKCGGEVMTLTILFFFSLNLMLANVDFNYLFFGRQVACKVTCYGKDETQPRYDSTKHVHLVKHILFLTNSNMKPNKILTRKQNYKPLQAAKPRRKNGCTRREAEAAAHTTSTWY